MAETLETFVTPEGAALAYRHVRRRGQKNLYLRVERDGGLVVSSPASMAKEEVEAFLRSRLEWIERKVAHRLTHVRLDPETWEEGCRVWYMGERYPVKKVAAPRNRLRLEGEGFVFECRDEGRFAQTLERFRLAEAKRVFSHRVAHWSQKMGLAPKAVRCRRYKSLWGLCRGDDTLVFNTALLRYDPELIDYVIVHELAHIRHKNHSKAFWALVARYIPDYRHLRSRLV